MLEWKYCNSDNGISHCLPYNLMPYVRENNVPANRPYQIEPRFSVPFPSLAVPSSSPPPLSAYGVLDSNILKSVLVCY